MADRLPCFSDQHSLRHLEAGGRRTAFRSRPTAPKTRHRKHGIAPGQCERMDRARKAASSRLQKEGKLWPKRFPGERPGVRTTPPGRGTRTSENAHTPPGRNGEWSTRPSCFAVDASVPISPCPESAGRIPSNRSRCLITRLMVIKRTNEVILPHRTAVIDSFHTLEP